MNINTYINTVMTMTQVQYKDFEMAARRRRAPRYVDVGQHDDSGDQYHDFVVLMISMRMIIGYCVRDHDDSGPYQESPLKTEVANAVYSRVASPTSPSSPWSNRVMIIMMMMMVLMITMMRRMLVKFT